jgi:hypothetical protein
VWHELWWHFCEIYVKFQDLAGDAGRRPACYSAVPTSYILKKKTKQFYKKFFFVIYLHSDSLIDILTNAVIIWDVLIAIISRNILRKFLGWQSLIRHACHFTLQNVQRIIYQDLSSNKFATVFLRISRISAGVHERLSFIFVFCGRIWIKQKATLKT